MIENIDSSLNKLTVHVLSSANIWPSHVFKTSLIYNFYLSFHRRSFQTSAQNLWLPLDATQY